MIRNILVYSFLAAVSAQAQTLALLSGNGQIVSANTGEGGGPIVFQFTSGGTPIPGALVSFTELAGGAGLPLTAFSAITDSNGLATVTFAPPQISDVSNPFTLTASAPGSNVVTFYETAALFPPVTTALVTPPNLAPYTAPALVAGPGIAIQIVGELPLSNISLSLVPVPLPGVYVPGGTVVQSISCSVNGALAASVLTGANGIATCAPVFSQPNAALNLAFNSLKFNVVIGGSVIYGPFTYNITAPPPTVNSGPKSQVLVVGTPVTATVTATGGTAPYTFALAAGSAPLPPGVTLESTGEFTGIPTTLGTYPFVVQVKDARGSSSTSAAFGLSFSVSGGPVAFTPTILEAAIIGVPYSQTISVTGGMPPYKLSTGGALPAGLSISFAAAPASTFTISGTPTTVGSFSFSIIGLDAANSTFQAPFPILVTMPLTVPGATLPPATLNTAYSFQLTPTNGVGPYIFTSTSLPAGFQLAPGGVLSGTPATPGLDSFSITVTDAYMESVMTVLVLPVSGGTLTVTSPIVLPAAVATAPYSQQIPAPTGGVPPYAYTLTGTVPTGISLTATGLLMGMFSASGPESLTFQVADVIGATATGTLQISVNAPVPILSAVTNGASSIVGAVAPGEIVSLYGTLLGPAMGVPATLTNGAFPTEVSGVQVMFGTQSAPVLFASAGQINAVVPFEAAPGTTIPVTVLLNGVSSAAVNVTVQDSAPGIFLIGPTQGAILNADNSVNSGTNGATVGSFVQVYATGSNPLTPQLLDGQLATEASTVSAADVSVTIGGIAAQVLYAGSAPGLVAGALQLNVIIPAGVATGPAVPIVLTIGNQSTSTETVTLGIQ